MNIFSDAIGMMTPVNVIMPENAKEPPAVLFLLHGMSDDNTAWTRRTSIERYVENKNLAVIMPTTHRGFYTDMVNGYAYWTYISQELPKKIYSMFNVSTKREKTFAAGLSMGGYGALKLGLSLPGRFAAVAGFSSAADMNARREKNDEYRRVFGEELSEENDLFCLAKKIEAKQAPNIYMWCGTEDVLLDGNRRFAAFAKECGLNVTYSESEGGHSWDKWDEQIRYALDWFDID